jgi:hypothetical protein
VAVPVDGTGIPSVAPVMALLVPGMQKPPRWVGKLFWDRLVEAPDAKVKIPDGLKTRPAWLRSPGCELGGQPGKDQCLPSAVLGVQGTQKVTPQTKLPRRRLREGRP